MSGYLETKNLSVGYHGKPLIEDVPLCVQRGKIVTLIGPNGSGKSTILKTVIGQLPELSGTVYLDGETMRSRSRNDVARRMAILMTARVEPELMTCRDVVSSGRYPYTGRLGVLRDEDKKIVEQSLSQVDALAFADAPFSTVSDGQRQRILLARALCQQPELIVLDEPTSYLDIRYKLELLMNQAGLTMGAREVEKQAHARSEATGGAPAAAIELSDGTVITGKTGPLLGATASALINALKYLAGIPQETDLVSATAIEPIQTESAYSLGMNRWQTMRYIILPQTFKTIIPALFSQCTTVIKDSSYLSGINVAELMYTANVVMAHAIDLSQVLMLYGLVFAMYFVLNFGISLLVRAYQRRIVAA